MTRPLAVTGFTMLFALFVLNSQNYKVIGAAAIAALIAFVAFMAVRATRQDRTLPVAALSVVLAALLLLVNNHVFYAKAQILDGKTIEVSGVLCELPYENNGNCYYVIKTETVNGEPSELKLRLVSGTPLEFTLSDHITVTAKAFLLGNTDEDILRYYKSKTLFLGAYAPEKIQIEKSETQGLSSRVLQLRKDLTDEIISVLPNDRGGVIAGLCFGDKTYIPRNVQTGFSAAGVSHLLAVSGLHLSVWSTLLFGLLRRLRVPQRTASVLAIVFIAFFAVLTGLNPPVLRAGMMLSMMFAAGLFKREADSINSIGAALTLMLLFNPYMAASVSLWLSVLATLGLILWTKPVSGFLNRPIKKLKCKPLQAACKFVSSMVAVSISVTAATLPVYLLALPAVSALLVISNLLMVTAGSLCMTTGGLASVLMFAGLGFAGRPLMLCSGVLSDYLIRVTTSISKMHRVLIPVNSNWSIFIFAAFLVFAAIILLFGLHHKKRVQVISFTLAAVFAVVNFSLFAVTDSKLKLTVASVGNGTAVILKYKGRTAVVGCGGDYYAGAAICDIISKYGSSTVDCLILPSDSSESTSGLSRLTETYSVGTVYTAAKNMYALFPAQNTVVLDKTEIISPDGRLKIAAQSGTVQAVQVLFGDFRAVISFTPQQSLDGASGDLLICCKALPSGTDYNAFDLAVISTSSKEVQNPFEHKNILLTSQNGDIAFLIEKDAKMQYWRTR